MIPVPHTPSFLVVIITSKMTERVNYYKRTKQSKAADCLVKINNNDFGFLSLDSAVNCNSTENLNINEIIHRVDEIKGFTIEKEKVPAYLRKEIVSAIMKSPLIPPVVKKLAKVVNPL